MVLEDAVDHYPDGGKIHEEEEGFHCLSFYDFYDYVVCKIDFGFDMTKLIDYFIKKVEH